MINQQNITRGNHCPVLSALSASIISLQPSKGLNESSHNQYVVSSYCHCVKQQEPATSGVKKIEAHEVAIFRQRRHQFCPKFLPFQMWVFLAQMLNFWKKIFRQEESFPTG